MNATIIEALLLELFNDALCVFGEKSPEFECANNMLATFYGYED